MNLSLSQSFAALHAVTLPVLSAALLRRLLQYPASCLVMHQQLIDTLQEGNEVCRLEHETPGYTFLHDYALTPTHYVLVQNPVRLDPAPFLLGKVSAAASVKWIEGKPAEVHLLRRPVVDADLTRRHQQQQQQKQQQQKQQQQDTTSTTSIASNSGTVTISSTIASGTSGRTDMGPSQDQAPGTSQGLSHQLCEVIPHVTAASALSVVPSMAAWPVQRDTWQIVSRQTCLFVKCPH